MSAVRPPFDSSTRYSCRRRPGKRLRIFDKAEIVRQTGEVGTEGDLHTEFHILPSRTCSLLLASPPGLRTRNRADIAPFLPLTMPPCLNKATANSPRKIHKALW